MNTLPPLLRQALKREKSFITKYYSGVSYPCLYRRINDGNNKTNHVQIFYEKNTPIEQGNLLTYGGKQFVTLNKETVENDTYYKSTLLECNLLLPVVVGSARIYIPCFIYDLTSPTIIRNNVITQLDGNGEIITESTDMINNIAIGSVYNILGGYFKVQNRHILSGISHVYVERTVKPEEKYAFELTASDSKYLEGTTTTIFAVPTINGVIDEAATITYSSSDNLVATVNSVGLATFLKPGSVTFTATWVEKNLTATVLLLVEADIPEANNTFILVCSNANNEVTAGSSGGRTFTASMYDVGGLEVAFTPVWTFDWNSIATTNFTVTYPSTYKCKIAVKDNVSLLGKTFTVTCTTDDGVYTKSILMTIVSGV